ncbi:Tub family protein [Toxoplasma gondii TgCatPRC2]|uniref:Tub family protein n=1 Tax=Toxoplasma gondii TgCatPRC2 TaxID=1130821 RepID=A0A151HB44_TOXGO|nr:Tub family protein [Toxoplasma gondii TgCatPRC2]
MSEVSVSGDASPAAAGPATCDEHPNQKEEKTLVVTITQTKYRWHHSVDTADPPPVSAPSTSEPAKSPEPPASSGLWKSVQDYSGSQAHAVKTPSLDVALQTQVVEMSAPVGADLLDGLPLFATGRLDTTARYSCAPAPECTYTPPAWVPRCVRQVLFVFDQEDHVTAEALWRVIEFCAQERAATLAGACASLRTGMVSARSPRQQGQQSRSDAAWLADAQSDARLADSWGVRTPELRWEAGLPRMDAAECDRRQNGAGLSADVTRFYPNFEGNAFLHRGASVAHPGVGKVESVSPVGLPSESERGAACALSREDLTRIGADAAALLATLPAEKLLETYASCLLLSQPLTRTQDGLRGRAKARGGDPRPALVDSANPCTLGAAASAEALRTLKETLGEQLSRKIDDVLLPASCCVAYRYDDPLLMDSCYWLLKRILLDKGLPAEWKELRKPETSTESDLEEQGTRQRSGDAAASRAKSGEFATAGASGVPTPESGASATLDWSWLPPSVFQKCAGRKMCYSVSRAVLTHLTYTVPLHSFWSVVADETFTKSKFLEEPKGYLHCEFRRVRSATPSTYPHAYLLLVDAASCRQLGLSEQVLCNQAQAKVLLLCGRRQSEHSSVEFFIPFPALITAVEPFCQIAEGSDLAPTATPKSPEGGETRPVVSACSQKLLAVVSAARAYGREFLGTLQGSFWGTKFSLTNWGLKQGYNHQLGASARASLEKRTFARLYRVYEKAEAGELSTEAFRAAASLQLQAGTAEAGDAFGGVWTQTGRAPSAGEGDAWRQRNPKKNTPVKYWELPYEEIYRDQENCEERREKLPEKMKWVHDCLFFPNCRRSPSAVQAAEGQFVEVVAEEDVGREKSREKSAEVSSNESRPEDAHPVSVLPHSEEEEPCTIHFERNLRGDMPRQMKVRLNRHGGAYTLQNVKAKWDEALQAYSLPFFGRAKVASAKNLQLIPCVGSGRRSSGKGQREECSTDDEEQTSIYLMMGKMSKDVYALDFRAPVRLFEAFAIAAATMAKKRAVT